MTYVPTQAREWLRWDCPYLGTLPPFKVTGRTAKQVSYQYQGADKVYTMSAKLFGGVDFRLLSVPVLACSEDLPCSPP